MRWINSLIAVGCLLLLCALSPSVAAAGGSLDPSLFGGTGMHVEFTLGKKPHTVLQLSNSGQRVSLEATRDGQSVTYEAAGRVSSHGVTASFGKAGKIDVRFEPSGPPRSVEPFPFCKGKDGSVTAGAFVGAIRFTGFDRFVHFHASRVRGQVSTTPPVHCHFPGGPKKHPPVAETGEPEDRTVALSVGRPCSGPVFIALADERSASPIMALGAISKEFVGRVQVSRVVLMFPRRRPGFFDFDPGLASATVAPPAPFHGTGAFQPGAGGAPPTWAGSLSVSFLDGRQALTGDGFQAKLESLAPGEDGALGEFKCEPGHAQMSALSIP